MGIKMIAMDMDGTLLRSDNTIGEKTLDALMEVQRRGIILVLASGRSYRKLIQYAKQLQMDRYGGYLIEVNGTARYDVKQNQREVYHQMTHEQMVEIFQEVKPFEVELLGMGDDVIYDYIPESMMEAKHAYRKAHNLSKDHPWTAGAFAFIYDNREGYPYQYQIQDGSEFPDTLNKLSIAHHPEILDERTPLIKQKLEDRYWLGLTSPGWLEIMPKGVTKGTGLVALCKELYITLDEVMAFGDGENDIDMLNKVGIGVTMANALPNVIACSSYTCADHNNDGIAETIHKMILSK